MNSRKNSGNLIENEQIKPYSKQSCEELGNYLRSFAAVNLSNERLAEMDFGQIASYAPVSPTNFTSEMKQALAIYSIFNDKKCGLLSKEFHEESNIQFKPDFK